MIVLATIVGCGGPVTADGITILRYGPQIGGPAALTSGTLRFISGCVILENIDANGAPTGQLVIWPPGTDLRVVDGQVFVAVGAVLATDGDEVRLGGGQYSDQAWVEKLVDAPVGPCESNLYWLATGMTVESS